MLNLIVNMTGIIASIEVREIVGKIHSDLLKDIRRYVGQLAESNIALGDFFTKSFYIDSTGRKLPC